MKRFDTDVVVIGAGTAGLAAYRAVIAAGRRAIIVEGGPHGTTCARVGCMPSKLLIAAADAAHGVAKWPEFGLSLDGALRVDGRAVMARVKRERDRFVGFVLDGVEAIPATHRVSGYARFIDDRTVVIDGHTRIDFTSAVIATGSSPRLPAAWRGLGDKLIVNDDVFAWDDLPASVAVFGPGVIGLELGQALHRLGVRVRVLGRSARVGPFSDPEVRAYAARTFASEFALDVQARVLAVKRDGDAVTIRYMDASGVEHTESFDYLIAATGRAPNVGSLGLENTSIVLDADGVPLFDRTTMQCGTSAVFIAGDASDDAPLLHEAADEGRIAGQNAAGYPAIRAAMRRAPIAVVFTDPQLAMVGAKHSDLTPGSFVVGAVSFENQGRSRVMLRNNGLLHVYADVASGRFLGAEMIGPDAEHIAHLLSWALQSGMTIEKMLSMPFYHPVVEEGLRTALRDARDKLARAVTATSLVASA